MASRQNQNDLLRTSPLQTRAIQTRDSILGAARSLILSVGIEKITLQAVADKASVPIGSVYHYFSGKPALIRAIAEESLENLRKRLNEELSPILNKSVEDIHFHRIVKKILDLYEEAYNDDPAFRIVWGGAQAHETLRELDIEDTRKNANLIADALECFVPKMKRERLVSLCMLICDSTASAIRLSISLDKKERRSIMTQLRGMVTNHLYAAKKTYGG